MIYPGRPEKRIYPDLERLSRAAAESLVALAGECIAHGDRFTLALSGGQTPRPLYRLLATTYRAAVPWRKVHLFWGDERYLPPDDPRSNYRMAKETLLDHVPVPHHQVHPIPTLLPEIEEAAEAYEETLMSQFTGRWPRFDLVLLGMGADGHIASLFPGNVALEEEARAVIAVRAESEIPLRVTLTLPAINQAANIWFLVTGKEKANAVALAFSERVSVAESPASGVRPQDGSLVWWLDEAAAGRSDSH